MNTELPNFAPMWLAPATILFIILLGFAAMTIAFASDFREELKKPKFMAQSILGAGCLVAIVCVTIINLGSFCFATFNAGLTSKGDLPPMTRGEFLRVVATNHLPPEYIARVVKLHQEQATQP